MRVDLRAQKPADGFTERFRLRAEYSSNHKPCVKVFKTLDEAKGWANKQENIEKCRLSRIWVPPSGLVHEYSRSVRDALLKANGGSEDPTLVLPYDLITIQMPEPRDEWQAIEDLVITGFYTMRYPTTDLAYYFERGAYSGADILLPHIRNALPEGASVTWQLTAIPIEAFAQWLETDPSELTWGVRVAFRAASVGGANELEARAIVSSLVEAWEPRFKAVMYLAMPFEDAPREDILEGNSKTFVFVAHHPYDSPPVAMVTVRIRLGNRYISKEFASRDEAERDAAALIEEWKTDDGPPLRDGDYAVDYYPNIGIADLRRMGMLGEYDPPGSADSLAD